MLIIKVKDEDQRLLKALVDKELESKQAFMIAGEMAVNAHKNLWKTIQENYPESKTWACAYDAEKGEITKQYKKPISNDDGEQ